jgi:hypothetical protein
MNNSSQRQIIALVFFVMAYTNLFSQGCSDAGACSMQSFTQDGDSAMSSPQRHFKVGVGLGKADHAITTFSQYVQFGAVLHSHINVNVKLTSILQSGNTLNHFGIGDVILDGSYAISETMHITAGAKIPLSSANQNHPITSLSLPMDYQPSLGTTDIIAGIGYTISNWFFMLALQQPITQNSNQFSAENYPADSPLRFVQSTNQFDRSGDIVGRIAYSTVLSSSWRLSGGVVPIYHLRNDRYVDNLGINREIIGSQGLTLNGNLSFEYNTESGTSFQIGVAAPFIVRSARPDGLTRSFLLTFDYKIEW